MISFIVNLLSKKKPTVGLDLGGHSLKAIKLVDGSPLMIEQIGYVGLQEEVYSQQRLEKPEVLLEALEELKEQVTFDNCTTAIAIPAPSVFSKRIKVPIMEPHELAAHVEFEAGNFIPHGADSVYLDYHVIGIGGKNTYDVLVVAVKIDLVHQYLDVLGDAGIEVGIVDIEPFAVMNSIEAVSEFEEDEAIALINIGSRYTSINVVRSEHSLLLGDLPIGGKQLTERISEELSLSLADSEELKVSKDPKVVEILSSYLPELSSELSRQLSFFWNASNFDGGISRTMITGGGSLLLGLRDAMEEETASGCTVFDPLSSYESISDLTLDSFKSNGSLFTVAVGLAGRKVGDRIVPSLSDEE